jgi:hypothetical protein
VEDGFSADVLGKAHKNSVRWVVGGYGELAFLALYKFGFVSGFVSCTVLKQLGVGSAKS